MFIMNYIYLLYLIIFNLKSLREGYEGKLNMTTKDLPCIKWTEDDVAKYDRSLVPESEKWNRTFLGDHNFCRFKSYSKIFKNLMK